MFEATGSIDINPPLAWSDVSAGGFMVADSKGVPVVPPGRWVELLADETLISRPEGVLHRYVFTALRAAAVEVPLDQREVMRQQVEAIVAAFPGSTFGAFDNRIRFRGNELDDIWRIRVQPDRTVQRQVASLSWQAPSLAKEQKMLAASNIDMATPQRITSRAGASNPDENHCGELDDHAPHPWGRWLCPGGPYAAPGNTRLGAV